MKSSQPDLFNRSNYSINNLEDEIRADCLCKTLLQEFHHNLLKNNELSHLEAGSIASGADYYLRDYIIGNQRKNIFDLSPELICSFAGNWYIVNTLEANMVELESILAGIIFFSRFCVDKKLLEPIMAEKIEQECSRHNYYQQRIESFNNISGAGFYAWNKQ